jgi:hypothetical protein
MTTRVIFNRMIRALICLFLFSFLDASQALANKKDPVPPCQLGEHWVRAHHRNAYVRVDGTSVSASQVLAHCQKDPPSYAKWKTRLLDSNATRGWKKSEKQKPWSEDERERVFEALSELPELLLLDSVHSIYRAVKSEDFDQNPASGDDGFIVLYDHAFIPKQNLGRVLAHELAHELFRRVSDDTRKQYASSVGWKTVKNLRTGKNQFVMMRFNEVEADSSESVTEDFANNIEYYLFDRERLTKKVPEASGWIQKTFGGTFKLGKGVR